MTVVTSGCGVDVAGFWLAGCNDRCFEIVASLFPAYNSTGITMSLLVLAACTAIESFLIAHSHYIGLYSVCHSTWHTLGRNPAVLTYKFNAALALKLFKSRRRSILLKISSQLTFFLVPQSP